MLKVLEERMKRRMFKRNVIEFLKHLQQNSKLECKNINDIMKYFC